jgi:glycosyltransferase involved in cell wall biosynthesis
VKIALVVHGRFHAFDLARALLQRGHDVTVFTNYPKWAAKRFGVSGDRVRSFWLHGVVSRAAGWLYEKARCRYPEAVLSIVFGRWAAEQIKKEPWDVVVCWSGIGEETFHALNGNQALRICHRSSSHIRSQARILGEEEKRTQMQMDRPGTWIIAREEREYALADKTYVPSSFARQTFLTEGVLPEKIDLIPHGVNTKAFRPTSDVIAARCARILSGEPLHILNVGTFSFRKGMWDMAEVIRGLGQDNFGFRFVGPIAPEASLLASELSSLATFIFKQPQLELPNHYAWGDIFILPTIEDGYPFVLAQASAAALPILTTPNGAGTDLVREGETGWVLPIRSPESFVKRLRWCHAHREELAAMVRQIYNNFQSRDWSQVAAEFETICIEGLKEKKLQSDGSYKATSQEAKLTSSLSVL